MQGSASSRPAMVTSAYVSGTASARSWQGPRRDPLAVWPSGPRPPERRLASLAWRPRHSRGHGTHARSAGGAPATRSKPRELRREPVLVASVEVVSKPLAGTSVECRGRTTRGSCSKPAPALAIAAATTSRAALPRSEAIPPLQLSLLEPPRMSLPAHPRDPPSPETHRRKAPCPGGAAGSTTSCAASLRPTRRHAQACTHMGRSFRQAATPARVSRPSVENPTAAATSSLSLSSVAVA
jgi:hypothetical protein